MSNNNKAKRIKNIISYFEDMQELQSKINKAEEDSNMEKLVSLFHKRMDRNKKFASQVNMNEKELNILLFNDKLFMNLLEFDYLMYSIDLDEEEKKASRKVIVEFKQKFKHNNKRDELIGRYLQEVEENTVPTSKSDVVYH